MQSFYDDHPDGITNKDYASFINLFRKEINESPDSLLHQTANYFINKNSIQGNLTILTRAKDTLQKSGKIEEFKQICDRNLVLCFYVPNQEDFSSINFNSAYNYSVFFDKESLFNNHELDFVRIISLLTTPKRFSNNESISISAKLLEKFFEYQEVPLEINYDSYTTIATTFGFKQTTYSALGTICIESIKVHLNFDVICCFIRCLSRTLIQLFDTETILSLFIKENQSKLRKFLIESLPYHCFLLLLSSFIKKFPDQVDQLVHLLEEILGDESTPLERCFGYTALSRIAPFISHPVEFSTDIIKYLLRDYDSQNPILPSLLESIYKTILKKCKSLNLGDQLYQILYDSIKNLSWHSMVKLMIIPDIIHSFPDLFGDLIDFAQDPSDYGFVTRCVKTIAKSSPKQTSEDLLKVIINSAMKNSIYNNLMNYRPILEPLYFLIPEIINKAFEMLNNISNGNYNDSNEVIIPMWLRFESLLILPRSKWPIKLFNLRGDLEYAIHSGNWDLQCSSFCVFAKCFHSDPIPPDFVLNLRTLMFTDSTKHTFLIEDAFIVYIDLLRPKKNSNNNDEFDLEKILLNLLDLFSYHMSSLFISSHRQFALSLTETIWKKYPHIYTQKHLDAIVSILNDNSLSLRFLCRDKIKAWIKEDPNKKFDLSSISKQLLFNDDNNNNNDDDDMKQSTTISHNDELLKKLVSEITNNNFESLKELESLISDNKSSSNKPLFSIEALDDQTDKYFDFFIATKNVGISYRSQTVFVSLCSLLEPASLAKKLQSWESRLLSILRDFDMESMRRSASLPDVALSLIRLQPSELTMDSKNNKSSRMTITTALIDLLKRTNIETEAVNSLNVLRAILKDRVMSKLDDYLYPLIFEAVMTTSMKFEGWDFVAASNLCFATVFHKLFKRSDSTLNIRQFFQKISKAKELIVAALNSKITHANYLALTVITSFRKTRGDDRSLLKNVVPFLSSRASRIRRTAALAAIVVTPEDEYDQLARQCVHYICLSRFAVHRDDRKIETNRFFEIQGGDRVDSNTFHGLLVVLRLLIERGSGEKLYGIDQIFPQIETKLVPPLVLDDVCFVIERIGASDVMNKPFKFCHFYFDQVSSIVCARRIPTGMVDLSDSQLVSLLTKIGAKNRKEKRVTVIEGLDRLIVSRLKKQSPHLIPPLIFKLSLDYIEAVIGIDSEVKRKEINGAGFDAADFLSDQIDTEIQTPLINMLNGAEKIVRFVPLFMQHAFSKDDSLTPVKISIAGKLAEILEASPDGKLIALVLMVDDVPLIRTKAAMAVSKFLHSQFLCEVELFDLLVGRLDERQLKFLGLKWIELIEEKLKCDPNGESISTLVDEFFVVQRVCVQLKLNSDIDFQSFQFIPISDARKKLISTIKPLFK